LISYSNKIRLPAPPLSFPTLSAERADRVDDASTQAPNQRVEPGQRLEDQLMLALIGLVPVADIGRDIAEITVELDRFNLGEDRAELAHDVIDLEMEDLREQLFPGHIVLMREIRDMGRQHEEAHQQGDAQPMNDPEIEPRLWRNLRPASTDQCQPVPQREHVTLERPVDLDEL